MENNTEPTNINPQYIGLVERYKEARKQPISVWGMKMLSFRHWYRWNKDKLTIEERKYLQENICKIGFDDIEAPSKEIDPWDE